MGGRRGGGGGGWAAAAAGWVEVTGFGVEDVDEDPDVGEDVGFLGGEVGLGEGVLSVPS